ncbi:MAG: hypothetical protein D8M28_02490 [Proteobacteria bacterium]|nr:hypothetical protein [Pseudomonadota bacterium]
MLLNSVKAIFVTVELEKNRNLDETVLFQKNEVANLTECVLRKHTNIPIYSSEEQSTNNTRDSVHIIVNLRLKTMDVANLDPFVIITVRFERNKPSVFSNKRMRYCADTFLLPNSLYAQQHALTKAMQYCLRPY